MDLGELLVEFEKTGAVIRRYKETKGVISGSDIERFTKIYKFLASEASGLLPPGILCDKCDGKGTVV